MLNHDSNDDIYKLCRKQSWASNMRRRVYDSLNVLLAAGFLRLNEKQIFEFDPNFDPSYLDQLNEIKTQPELKTIK